MPGGIVVCDRMFRRSTVACFRQHYRRNLLVNGIPKANEGFAAKVTRAKERERAIHDEKRQAWIHDAKTYGTGNYGDIVLREKVDPKRNLLAMKDPKLRQIRYDRNAANRIMRIKEAKQREFPYLQQ